MLDELKINRRFLSSLYIACLVSFFLFQLSRDLILSWAGWIRDLLSLRLNVDGNTPIWLILFFLCFFITLLIRRIVILPLGFFHGEEGASNWEMGLQGFFILGLYIYLLNQIFTQPMPLFLPDWVIRGLGGFENTFPAANRRLSPTDQRVWNIVPWLWYLAPIATMYIAYLRIRIESYLKNN